ncbi:hypothetical protein ZOSMA_89G01260 [Zostera marina]|uniref:Uncharacterized protein n=1 Tax=Zostera marina TaxID=29655 RepID=A0A0K9NKN6_ZOSMR|nr:hypothetical protein ZOSMA_89G01260 [Zostera marina]
MTQRVIHGISANRNSNKDDGSWVVYLQKMLDDVTFEDDGVQVTISSVPRSLLESKPEAFVPQLIAIGPYHHWRPELYDMEKYKLSAVKRIQRKARQLKFKDLIDSILIHECRIRENYHKNLDFHRDTLGGLMAIDTCFLLEFLEVYSNDKNESARNKSLDRISSRMTHLVDNTGQKSGHNIILRDVMMLENQIPLFLLLKILNWQYETGNNEQRLIKILGGFVKELSPLKTTDNTPDEPRMIKHAHLLALLYHSLLPCGIETSDSIDERTVSEIKEQEVPVESPISNKDDGLKFKGKTIYVTEFFHRVWKILLATGLRALKPLLLVMKIPWKIFAVVPGVSHVTKRLGYFIPSGILPEQLNDGDKDKQPLMEEISVPSVEELISSGVKLVPTNGDLTSIKFDYGSAKLHLPTITLDVNTEVILRNLVAYETSVVSGPLVFTRYTELMNGIIDTEEDVRLLRRNGILKNYMKSDKEVAEVWNGMSRSVRLTKVPFMDNMIKDVNKFYNSNWKVKAKKLMKNYIVRSWPFLTFLAAILLLLLTGLQAFCSVYECTRWLDLPDDSE